MILDLLELPWSPYILEDQVDLEVHGPLWPQSDQWGPVRLLLPEDLEGPSSRADQSFPKTDEEMSEQNAWWFNMITRHY